MRELIAFLLLPLACLAQGKPQWLLDLEAKKAEPVHVDRVIAPQPADSKLGYWTVTHERIPAQTKEVKSVSIQTGETGTRTITAKAKIIHSWSWVEEPANFQGNTKSEVFHREGCRYWDCRDCTRYFSTAEDALEQGFRPCGACKPLE